MGSGVPCLRRHCLSITPMDDNEMEAWEAASEEAWETVERLLLCSCNGSRASSPEPRPVDSGHCRLHG
jgi:hypothetical protein